jgi:HK97 family phage major capsid protein/HK97 family phage prohead protease
MTQRAYSVLRIKSFDEDARIIEGIASTPTTDRVGDVVEPKGAQFSLPVPFLWQHRSDQPIGHVVAAQVEDDGIRVRVQIAQLDEPGELKSMLDRAWQSIKIGLVRGLSIGFRSIEAEDIKGSWGQRFTKWDWMELSAVTIPANVEANILAVKSYDTPAASGETAVTTPPGVSGRPVVKLTKPKPKGGTVTVKERIAAFEARRAAHAARLTEISEKAGAEGRTKDEAEQEEYNGLKAEMKSIDLELTDLREEEKLMAAQAKPVETKTVETAKTVHVSVKPNVDKAIPFARAAMCLARAKGNRFEAAMIAEREWADTPEVAQYLKAPVAAGTSTTAGWASNLVPTNFTADFLEMLRPRTLVGRMTGLKRVPFNVSFPSQTAGGTYAWVGENAPKPVTRPTYGTVTLGTAKAAGIIVLTEELVRNSSPSAQETVRNEMLEGMARYLDGQFINPAVAPVVGVSPGSITNTIVGVIASGVTEAAARADLRALVARFAAANYDLGGLVLLTSESMAFTLGTIVNAVGQTAFPGLSVTGGSILGIPVIASNAVGNQIVGVHAPSVMIAGDESAEIDISREASIQMEDAPDNPLLATTVLRSLWQHNLVGLKVEHWINWGRARATAVDRIHTVAYV